ncbi:MAG TPA: toxin-antitoxin system HicB family antitoxin [Acidimicrobiia bacterium]|jgi:hypothetical protein
MDLGPSVDRLRHQVEVAAEAGGEEARALAARVLAPLDAAIRLTLQDALTVAAEEITCELAPGSVELRVRGRDLEFVVTPPPAEPDPDELGDADPRTTPAATDATAEDDEGAIARINLRMPEHLKARVEQTATGEGVSINAWLVRAVSAALERGDAGRRTERRAAQGPKRYTGWAR